VVSVLKALPKESLSPEEVFKVLENYVLGDMDPYSGRMWGHIYNAGLDDLLDVARRAYLMFMDKTMLDFTTYPSILKMENDVVSITASLMNGDENVVGNFTYGGTESIMLAVKAARDLFRKKKGNATPEIILPSTAHPAFYKSAEFLGLRVVRTGVDPETFKADVDDVSEAIGKNTAIIVGSAPNYPFGVVDDIKGFGELAIDHDLWLHVDACLGGFVLPFFKKLGEKVPDFDFSVDGVSSISADLHKYGYAPRGASVILHRNKDLRINHIFVKASWPGYPLVNTAVLSTRSAGTLAASWAVLHYLGEQGYVRLAEKILRVKKRLMKELPSLGFKILGEPESGIMAFTSENVNVFRLSSLMTSKGWYVQAQPGSKLLNFPKSLHLTITPNHERVIDSFLQDLSSAMLEIQKTGKTEMNIEEVMKSLGLYESELGDLSGKLDSLLSILDLSEGETPGDMVVINELIHIMPPEMVELVFRSIINDILFKPTRV
jgi:glutamate/tyrosine decarboxylase-like PLP-dependent enzyme